MKKNEDLEILKNLIKIQKNDIFKKFKKIKFEYLQLKLKIFQKNDNFLDVEFLSKLEEKYEYEKKLDNLLQMNDNEIQKTKLIFKCYKILYFVIEKKYCFYDFDQFIRKKFNFYGKFQLLLISIPEELKITYYLIVFLQVKK